MSLFRLTTFLAVMSLLDTTTMATDDSDAMDIEELLALVASPVIDPASWGCRCLNTWHCQWFDVLRSVKATLEPSQELYGKVIGEVDNSLELTQ